MSINRRSRLCRCSTIARRFPSLITVSSILVGSCSVTLAASDQSATPATAGEVSNEVLLKKLQAMEKRVQTLEAQLKKKQDTSSTSDTASQTPAPARTARAQASALPTKSSNHLEQPASTAQSPTPTAPPDNGLFGVAPSPVQGLSFGAYGEVHFGAMQNPAAGGQWQLGSDAARRLVLLPTYAITDNIIFNAEIEFEHAGAGFDNDDKLHGTAEIEQLWIDFKIADAFNWRAPGVDLVPIGYINQHHEPTEFYSVFRPELYNGLIPSTWKVPGTSVYGTIMDGVKYQVMVSAAQEDFGDSFDCRTDANTVPLGNGTTPCGQGGAWYAPGFDGHSALTFSNPPLGDFRQLSNSLAVSGRLDFTEPASIPGLAWSVSGYYASNTTPRGAHDDFGNSLGHASFTMFDTELRYRMPNTGLELRGEYVEAIFGNPANLRANNDSDPTDNVGKRMYGYSGEAAYHIPLGTIINSEWEAVPFYRYTYQNLQTGGFAGTDINAPTGAGQTQFQSMGIAVFPSPKVVLKATYQKVKNNDPAGAKSDSVLGGVGFFF